jgi:hypothetical protein
MRSHNGPERRVALLVLVGLVLPLQGSMARAEVQKLSLYQKTGRAPLVVWGTVADGEHMKAVIRTHEVVKCDIPQRPGESFLLAFRLDSFLREPWQDKITFKTGEEVVLFLRKFTKEDGDQPEKDLYTLMWGAEGKFSLPPEGAQAYVEAIRVFEAILTEPDPDRQEEMLIEGIKDENPFIVEAAFEEMLRQYIGGIDLIPDLIEYFDNPRESFRILAMRLMTQVLDSAAIADREIPERPQLANRIRGRAALDEAAGFRVEAVKALAILGGDESRALLERLSKEDPSQDVRFEASRMLLSWTKVP